MVVTAGEALALSGSAEGVVGAMAAGEDRYGDTVVELAAVPASDITLGAKPDVAKVVEGAEP